MTKEELAERINDRGIGDEITETEEAEAKTSRLLVIFGASDDLCELRGAINDEVDVYGGETILIGRDGKLLPEIDEDDIEILDKYQVTEAVRLRLKDATRIDVIWCGETGYSWTYKTDAPHATFEIMEDDEHYCRGIVIDLKELEIPEAA